MNKALLIAGGAVAGFFLISKAANAAAVASDTDSTAADYINPWGLIEQMMNAGRAEQAIQSRNMRAFLSAIARAEGTDRAADPYRVCYGYKHTIFSLQDHPAVTGEWKGEPLSAAMCAAAGVSAGCVSTAAGRYQIKKATWLEAKRALGLKDFSKASQDKAAAYLIDRRGATDEVEAGNIERAVALCAKEWASLPGAGYGQPVKTMAAIVAAYKAAGGAVA